jgi:hypothetical protein
MQEIRPGMNITYSPYHKIFFELSRSASKVRAESRSAQKFLRHEGMIHKFLSNYK